RQPGLLARLFGAGPGVAGWAVPSLLGAIAGAVAASALAAPFLVQASRALASATGAACADPGAVPADDLVAEAGPGDDLDPDLDLGFDDLFDA
ncbi:MAG: hypothetical protein WCK28_04910, partial [Burkholderiales bacterium]